MSDALRSSLSKMCRDAMTVHEVKEDIVELVLREVYRVLMNEAQFVVLDKFLDLYRGVPPSEELVLLVENAFHKAVEYVYGVRVYGIRPLNNFIAKANSIGFEASAVEKVMISPWIDGETFLKSWRRTRELAQKLSGIQRK